MPGPDLAFFARESIYTGKEIAEVRIRLLHLGAPEDEADKILEKAIAAAADQHTGAGWRRLGLGLLLLAAGTYLLVTDFDEVLNNKEDPISGPAELFTSIVIFVGTATLAVKSLSHFRSARELRRRLGDQRSASTGERG